MHEVRSEIAREVALNLDLETTLGAFVGTIDVVLHSFEVRHTQV